VLLIGIEINNLGWLWSTITITDCITLYMSMCMAVKLWI